MFFENLVLKIIPHIKKTSAAIPEYCPVSVLLKKICQPENIFIKILKFIVGYY